MNAFRIRRATVDDIAQLMSLWAADQLSTVELEQRFTEFQVAEDADGKVVAAIGLQIIGAEAKIHSETFSDFALSDTIRSLFWDRLEVVCKNHGLCRLWTLENAPFWKKNAGFSEAPEPIRQNLPEGLGDKNERWLVLRLKDEAAFPASIEQQFALFKESEKEQREKLLRPARVLLVVGWCITIVIVLIALRFLVRELLHI